MNLLEVHLEATYFRHFRDKDICKEDLLQMRQGTVR